MPKVPKTSGQGTSRGAYQTAYKLGAKGTGESGSLRSPSVKTGLGASQSRSYTKSGVEAAKPMKWNVSYGDTIEPGTLQDINKMVPELKAKGAKGMNILPAKKWK